MGLRLQHKIVPFLIVVLVMGAVSICFADSKVASLDSAQVDPVKESLEELVAADNVYEPVEGVATYYAKKFIGRRTASGQRYHPDKMTGAHYTLPLGTVVRVLNPANNKDVYVTINDRCAPKKFPFIDLSRAAAKKIGLWGKGKIKVIIMPLAEVDEEEQVPGTEEKKAN
jgi:rare lipoprotein A